MNEQNHTDTPPEPAEPVQTVAETIRALRALRTAVRARKAAHDKILYPNACRGARIAGVPVSKLPPHLRSVEPAEDAEE